MKNRLNKVRKNLKQKNIQNLLVSNPKNIFYLTGVPTSSFHRESFLFINEERAILFHSSFLQIPSKSDHFESITISRGKYTTYHLEKMKLKKIWIESSDLSVREYKNFKQKLTCEIISTDDVVEKARMIKDSEEIIHITKSCEIAKNTWEEIRPQIVSGKTEKEIQALIITTLLKHGADQIPSDFLPIVASGKNSAYPHHKPSDKKIAEEDVVMIDFGCTVGGYYSDMTRTISLGKNLQSKKVEDIVKKAYQAGVNELSSRSSQEVDRKVKSVIDLSPYRDTMIHSTGHGVGLDIHEKPSLSIHAGEVSLSKGMAITIEPGIYLPGKFGYRYENTILIQDNEVIELT